MIIPTNSSADFAEKHPRNKIRVWNYRPSTPDDFDLANPGGWLDKETERIGIYHLDEFLKAPSHTDDLNKIIMVSNGPKPFQDWFRYDEYFPYANLTGLGAEARTYESKALEAAENPDPSARMKDDPYYRRVFRTFMVQNAVRDTIKLLLLRGQVEYSMGIVISQKDYVTDPKIRHAVWFQDEADAVVAHQFIEATLFGEFGL